MCFFFEFGVDVSSMTGNVGVLNSTAELMVVRSCTLRHGALNCSSLNGPNDVQSWTNYCPTKDVTELSTAHGGDVIIECENRLFHPSFFVTVPWQWGFVVLFGFGFGIFCFLFAFDSLFLPEVPRFFTRELNSFLHQLQFCGQQGASYIGTTVAPLLQSLTQSHFWDVGGFWVECFLTVGSTL